MGKLREGEGEGDWSDVEQAQQTWFELSAEYVNQLAARRRAEIAILGLLLVDGMDAPPAPPSESLPQRQDQLRQLRENI